MAGNRKYATATDEISTPLAAANYATASNAAAVVTVAAAATKCHAISGLAWSYSGSPTSGMVKIEDGSGTTVFSLDITAAGPGSVLFGKPMRGTVNTALIVTLAAGGGGVVGKVNLLGYEQEGA